jgi:membrane-associated phospholipid phosphatase
MRGVCLLDILLDMLKWLQSVRTPVFNTIFTTITMLGEDYFAILVLCLILWCVNKKAGYIIGFAYLTSWIVNFSVKEFFHVPRPFTLDTSITPIRPETATGYSFPSGHTQSIASLSTALSSSFKRKWLYIAGTVLTLLMAVSRLYLGVHTLLDVMAGVVTGFLWVFIAYAIYKYAERNMRQPLLLLLLIPAAIAMIFIQDTTFYKITGTFLSFLIGYLVDLRYIKYETAGSLWQKAVRYIVGIAVLLAIKTFVKMLIGEGLAADFIRYFLIGTWISVAAPLLFKRFLCGKAAVSKIN